jgi:hypothetical protein
MSRASLYLWRLELVLNVQKEVTAMFRKSLIVFLMAPLLAAAVAAGTSFPVVFLMLSLLLIAIATPSAREEPEE